MWIYKITNKINQKLYVGITIDLEQRWKLHKQHGKNPKGRFKRYPLYKAMLKYGLDNFIFEVIRDDIESLKELGDLERYYIRELHSHVSEHGYNLTWGGEKCQYDGNPRATLTVEDVIEIRLIYNKCEIGVSECWQLYKDRISYSAFEKVWEGSTWKGIMDEVYTEENKNKHKKEISCLFGSTNPNALYTEQEVLEIRKYYVTHSLTKTYEKFGSKSKSKSGFRNVIDRSYPNIPMYSKIKKKWFLKDKEINIENYKPVSTISVSGE